MLRLSNNNKAQARMTEYAVLIAMVMAVIVTMTVYFKRGLQARIHDARDYMLEEIHSETRGSGFDGNLYVGYEPYYGNTSAIVARDVDDHSLLEPGASSGIFTKNYGLTVRTMANSETAPPREAMGTTPPAWTPPPVPPSGRPRPRRRAIEAE